MDYGACLESKYRANSNLGSNPAADSLFWTQITVQTQKFEIFYKQNSPELWLWIIFSFW